MDQALTKMEKQISKENLKLLVAKGKQEEVFDALLPLAAFQDQELNNVIYALVGDYEDFKRKSVAGILSVEDVNLINNNLRLRLLQILDELEITDSKESVILPSVPITSKNTKIPKRIIFPAFLLLSLIIFIIFKVQGVMKDSTAPNQSNWIGDWEGTISSEKNQSEPHKISILFELNNESLIGNAVIYARKGGKADLSLSNIEVSGKFLKGEWQEDLDTNHPQKGLFEFELSNDPNKFTGKSYTKNKQNQSFWIIEKQ